MQTCACRDDVRSPVAIDPFPSLIICITVVRDVRERGRDIEGCIKQWFAFVKPNFHKYVEVQRNVAGRCSVPVALLVLNELQTLLSHVV